MDEVDTVIRIRNDKKWRHFLSLEGWRGDIGEIDEDSQEIIWSYGVLVHSGNIYSAAALVTNESWNEVVLQSATPVLVEFHGSGCVPCNNVRKVVDELKIEYRGRLKFFVLYADQDGAIVETYEVEAMPTSLVFRNGEERERVAGTSREEYQAAIERVINEV
ncbi:hypothetical protein C3L33_23254, partial [Rhododendron williamsianum]